MEATFGPNLERRKEISDGLRRMEGCGYHVMGVLNITPDSFHEASRLASTQQAVQTGLAMWEDGAKWLDIEKKRGTELRWGRNFSFWWR